MIFIETDIFTEDVQTLLSDEEYAKFQVYLSENPLIGDVIQETGGLRKVRWSAKGKGKRSGVRIISYYVLPDAEIRLLFDLSKRQAR